MIGQDYFDLRSRLGSALVGLRGLDLGSDENAAIVDSLIGGLRDPFVFVVVGEVNVGKSTFLNALFGADFSQTGVMPTTEKILFFKHGPELRRVPVTRTLEEVQVPAEFLRDFNVVDTPGTNSIENEHQEITERFVPTADLVIFVFSAMNPWGASAWQFLEKVHQQWMRNVIFVLQQSDLREPEEVQSILAYMKRLCVQRFGREFPIFPVSAKRAYLARSSGVDRDRLLAESGFDHLERHITGLIGGNNARLVKLAGTIRTARQVLDSIRSASVERIDHRVRRAGVLRSIDAGLSAQAQRTYDKLSHVTESTVNDLRRASKEALALVAAQLTPRHALRSAFREKRSFTGIDTQLQESLGTAGLERWSRAVVIFEDDVAVTADQLEAQLAEGLRVQADEAMWPDAAAWEEQRRRFLEQINRVHRRALDRVDVEERLEPVLRSTRRLAQWQIFAPVLGILAAIGCGMLGWWVALALALAAAVAAFFVIERINARRLSVAFQDCEDHLAEVPADLNHQLERQLRDETLDLYDNFNRVLLPVRQRMAEQERSQSTEHDRIQQVGRTLDGIEAELGRVDATA